MFFEPTPGALREAGQVLDEGIEAAVLEVLQPAQGGDHPLTDAATLTHALDELEVGADGAVFVLEGLPADEHAEERARWLALRQSLNPLQLHRELDEFIAGLQHPSETAMSAD